MVEKMKVYIVGTGMEGKKTLTEEAKSIIENAEALIGARRMVEPYMGMNKQFFLSWNSEEIAEYLCKKSFTSAAILVSGDCGFYSGAEKLLGQGDMLFSPVGAQKPLRIQGCFVSDSEIESVVDFVKNSRSVIYDDSIAQEIERSAVEGSKSSDSGSNDDEDSGDPMMNEAIKCVVEAGQASTSLLQRRLRLGYARAGRIIDEMEQMGIVGPHEGSKPRQVLITYAQWLEMNMQKQDTPGNA